MMADPLPEEPTDLIELGEVADKATARALEAHQVVGEAQGRLEEALNNAFSFLATWAASIEDSDGTLEAAEFELGAMALAEDAHAEVAKAHGHLDDALIALFDAYADWHRSFSDIENAIEAEPAAAPAKPH